MAEILRIGRYQRNVKRNNLEIPCVKTTNNLENVRVWRFQRGVGTLSDRNFWDCKLKTWGNNIFSSIFAMTRF